MCSTALLGKNLANSLASCAASVLLWAMTSAGLPGLLYDTGHGPGSSPTP